MQINIHTNVITQDIVNSSLHSTFPIFVKQNKDISPNIFITWNNTVIDTFIPSIDIAKEKITKHQHTRDDIISTYGDGKKYLLLYFCAEYCTWCKRFEPLLWEKWMSHGKKNTSIVCITREEEKKRWPSTVMTEDHMIFLPGGVKTMPRVVCIDTETKNIVSACVREQLEDNIFWDVALTSTEFVIDSSKTSLSNISSRHAMFVATPKTFADALRIHDMWGSTNVPKNNVLIINDGTNKHANQIINYLTLTHGLTTGPSSTIVWVDFSKEDQKVCPFTCTSINMFPSYIKQMTR